MKKCELCGADISKTRRNKYCSKGCRQIAYHRNKGVQVWVKPCGCGCGGVIVSKTEEFKRDVIIGHPRINKFSYGRCELCHKEIEMLYDYQLSTFKMRVCMPCYEKVFDLSL